MASTPQYSATVNTGIVVVSTANTNLDGTGTLGTVLTAGSSGSRIDDIHIKAIATTTAGCVRIFIHNGSSAFLVAENPVLALSPSATIPAYESHLNQENCDFLPLSLPTGYSLRASTEKAESFNIIAQGGDF